MKVALFTNEYPPNIYGGAGVHVDYLAKFLAQLVTVEVRTFGEQKDPEKNNPRAVGFSDWDQLGQEQLAFTKVLRTLAVNLAYNNQPLTADVVHCHTWYTFFAGFLAKILYGLPLVVTMHSLEPLRPWKEEQLGTGYLLSSWIEKNGVENADRIIAVSEEMKTDIIKAYQTPAEKITVIHNGIDLNQYHPVRDRSYLEQQGIDFPYLLFVGRISRQKGIIQLLEAMARLDQVHLVLCASSPDTPELEREVRAKVAGNPYLKWINEMVPKEQVIQLYSHAAAFICPSIYEPFGIINLEAMACKAPVIASRVGGIKEVVLDGETGFLVNPDDPEELAEKIRVILNNPELAARFKEAGRKRVEDHFSWETIANRTVELYTQVSRKPGLVASPH
ncbi:MAG: glycogen synthase [Firmicutes bacterium]|nr:glycogen synthase [Bacillota bacterium]